MSRILSGPGFLGTRAPLVSDLTLVLILLTAVLFSLGVLLAVRRRYEAHRWVQTTAAVINAVVVLGVMINSFIVYILPGIPNKLLEGSYGITTIHALVGAVGLVFGLFVVLRGNGLVPKRMQFTNYKLFMRLAYFLYMLATLFGIVVYIAAFIAPA